MILLSSIKKLWFLKRMNHSLVIKPRPNNINLYYTTCQSSKKIHAHTSTQNMNMIIK